MIDLTTVLTTTAATYSTALDRGLKVFPRDRNFDPHITDLEALAAKHDARAAEIATDRGLTEEGRTLAYRRLNGETRKAASKLRDQSAGSYERRLQQERAAILAAVTPKPPTDPQERMRREAETARLVRDLERVNAEPFEIRLRYSSFAPGVRDQLAAAPPVAVRAPSVNGVPGALMYEPLIPAELREADLLSRAQAKNPQHVDLIDDLDAITAALNATHNAVLAQLGPDADAPDPIAEAAAAR